MKHKHWCVRRGLVQLVQRRHPPLRELKLRPAAHHPDPLSRWSSPSLLSQHSQTVRERRYAIPAKFEIVVEPAANQVSMRIIQAWDGGPFVQIDELGLLAAPRHHLTIGSNGEKLAVENGNGLGDRPLFVLRSDFAVPGNEICGLVAH